MKYFGWIVRVKDVRDIGIYTHVSNKDIGKIKSPLNNLQIRGGKMIEDWRSSTRGMYMRTMFGYIDKL